MTKRKLSFNFVDFLLVLMIAAAVFVLLYVFVLSGRFGTKAATNNTNRF